MKLGYMGSFFTQVYSGLEHMHPLLTTLVPSPFPALLPLVSPDNSPILSFFLFSFGGG